MTVIDGTNDTGISHLNKTKILQRDYNSLISTARGLDSGITLHNVDKRKVGKKNSCW